jgi:hypothetical protein
VDIDVQSLEGQPFGFTLQNGKKINAKYDAEINALESKTTTVSTQKAASEQLKEISNDQIVDSLLKDYKKKLGRKLSKLSGEVSKIEGGILMYDASTNSIIENKNVKVSYEQEVIKVPGGEFSYSVWENKIKESIINNLENIRNIQKNSVSLQNNPKIENKVEVKGTEENKIKEKEVSDIEKQTAFKTYNDMLQQRDRALTSLNRIKDPVKQTRLSETIKKLETDINNIALKHGFTKC